jgi:hypothetical protein
MEDEIGILDVLHDFFETERVFYGVVRFLEGTTRNNLVAAHMRNTGIALDILRTYMVDPSQTMVMNIDLSGNALRNFLDPVPVVPSRDEVSRATDTAVDVTNTVCAICQESVTTATRIRQCGHCFHGDCIGQWLAMNPRCPVCRHDIRNPLTDERRINENEDNRVHPNE